MTKYLQGLLLLTESNHVIPIMLVKKQGKECEEGWGFQNSEKQVWQPGVVTSVVSEDPNFYLPNPVQKINAADFFRNHPDGICASISVRFKSNPNQGYFEAVDIYDETGFLETEKIWKDMCKREDIDGIPQIEYSGI